MGHTNRNPFAGDARSRNSAGAMRDRRERRAQDTRNKNAWLNEDWGNDTDHVWPDHLDDDNFEEYLEYKQAHNDQDDFE